MRALHSFCVRNCSPSVRNVVVFSVRKRPSCTLSHETRVRVAVLLAPFAGCTIQVVVTDFVWGSVIGGLVVVGCAALFRSKAYAVARGVFLTIYTLIAVALEPSAGPMWPVFYALHALVYLQSLALVRPRLRPPWFVALISVPGLFFASGMLLAFPWAIAVAFGATPHGWWLPFIVSLFGVWQSLTTRSEEKPVVIDGTALGSEVARCQAPQQPTAGAPRPLRVVQITDPHLGPFMSVRRLRSICQRAVDRQPDLIVLTGDFLTMESQSDSAWLAEALEPLRQLPGRVFACLGNHDYEALDVVRDALQHAGVRLLMDEAEIVETECCAVQVVGFEFHWRQRAPRMAEVCSAHPRVPGMLRLALLHDPGAFKHLPAGEADLVLSGHTHGGQLGLVSFNLPFTIANAVAKIPDHGLWARGTDRLYVHRGTGHYGFPLRLGVPAEESVLLVYMG